jgi:hypothetical protein
MNKEYFVKNKKYALITGATSGIGKATAEILAEKGYHLICLARRFEKLQNLKQELEARFKNQEVHIFSCDLQEVSQIEKFLKEAQSLISQTTILINNAGLAKGVDKFQNSNPEDWDQMFDTNVRGLLRITRGVLPSMLQLNEGHIVNLGSVAGRLVYPGGAIYCATKFAVRALNDGLRMDLLGTPIRVSNIEPGMVDTEFSVVRLGDAQKAQDVYKNMTPLKAQDIAETILWVLQRPSHVNIQEVVIYPTDQASVGQVYRKP